MRGICTSAVLALLFTAILQAAPAIPTKHTFDATAEGWTITGGGPASWQVTGGHPNGCLVYSDATAPTGVWISAPVAYLGDWSTLKDRAVLAWDQAVLSLGDSPVNRQVTARLTGPGGQATYGASPDVTTSWRTFEAPIKSSAWTVTGGTWDALLANVTSLEILITAVEGNPPNNPVNAVDNVTLKPQVVINAFTGFDTGMEGWTPADSAAAYTWNPRDRRLQYDDNYGSDGWVIAPGIFLGDWSALQNKGAFSYDHQVLDPGGQPSYYRAEVVISAKGCSAHWTGATAYVPAVWATWSIPVKKSAWTVTQGSWETLVKNVESVQIRLEGANNGANPMDKDALDNVAIGYDCNGNSIADKSDIVKGTSKDLNANGWPDECDVDADGDGVIDFVDGCPQDAAKTAPGFCGCGKLDVDTDNDGTMDCVDLCPLDPGKQTLGACGCGVPDTDSDGDGTADCKDGCPADRYKVAPGQCGCGNLDTDTDRDKTADCNDGCPTDPNKPAPGICGCGVLDTDTDLDGTPNCNDLCPNDATKIDPGVCGCGKSDADSDGDGVENCNDECPMDPAKVEFGDCGCGVPDTDTDGDGQADCVDECPNDGNKALPGVCGCGNSDVDTDADGVSDCKDACDTDPGKVAVGKCGCGVSDRDADRDGTPDCLDGCPADMNKIRPGTCGCGNSDVDSDGDGVATCRDGCPSDPRKIAPGLCGCGEAETDTDGDKMPDCRDECPLNPAKTRKGMCGCDVAETDLDNDGVSDCVDRCPNDPGKIVPGLCGCGVSDADSDADGTRDCFDFCPSDPLKITPGKCGCGVLESQCGGNTSARTTETDTGRSLPETLAPQCGTGAASAVATIGMLLLAVPALRRRRGQ